MRLVIRQNYNGRYFVVNTINGMRMSECRYFKFMAERDLAKLRRKK